LETNPPSSAEIEKLIASFGISDTASFMSDMEKFRLFLIEENEKYNLTRLTSPDEFWIKHVIDCLYILKYYPELKTVPLKLADIGSGAGFPALILARACPSLKISAIESSIKKSDFISRTSKLISLSNLSVVPRRAHELSEKKEWRFYFDVITARALSSCREIFRETRPLLNKTGRYILYKTPRQAETELCEIRNFTAQAGFRWNCTETFKLPADMGERLFIHGAK